MQSNNNNLERITMDSDDMLDAVQTVTLVTFNEPDDERKLESAYLLRSGESARNENGAPNWEAMTCLGIYSQFEGDRLAQDIEKMCLKKGFEYDGGFSAE